MKSRRADVGCFDNTHISRRNCINAEQQNERGEVVRNEKRKKKNKTMKKPLSATMDKFVKWTKIFATTIASFWLCYIVTYTNKQTHAHTQLQLQPKLILYFVYAPHTHTAINKTKIIDSGHCRSVWCIFIGTTAQYVHACCEETFVK